MLRDPNDSSAIDRRFNVLITSTTYEEFYYHLRQMVNLLRSNKRILPVNYARLAEDLYWFQRGYEENIRLRWAQNYYRRIKEEEEKQS
jgi:CRISPR system Cascade subunit CasB